MKLLCVAAALLVQGGAAASLRAAPAKPADAVAKPAPKVPESAQDLKKLSPAITDKVADTIAKALNANAPAVKAPVAAGAQQVQHKKLDVGFQDFEKTLTEEISAKLLLAAKGPAWTEDMRSKLTKNISDVLKVNLKDTLKPLKQSIGKTWMALPKDEQKDEYVETLKKSFDSVFGNSKKSILSHLDLSLKRVDGYSNDKAFSQSQLLEKSEFSVADSLITEHCYDSVIKKPRKDAKKSSNSTEVPAAKKKFCIQSVIGALAHRLNDTQGLISMSMRFEAGAMTLIQKKQLGLLETGKLETDDIA